MILKYHSKQIYLRSPEKIAVASRNEGRINSKQQSLFLYERFRNPGLNLRPF